MSKLNPHFKIGKLIIQIAEDIVKRSKDREIWDYIHFYLKDIIYSWDKGYVPNLRLVEIVFKIINKENLKKNKILLDILQKIIDMVYILSEEKIFDNYAENILGILEKIKFDFIGNLSYEMIGIIVKIEKYILERKEEYYALYSEHKDSKS